MLAIGVVLIQIIISFIFSILRKSPPVLQPRGDPVSVQDLGKRICYEGGLEAAVK